MKPFKWVGYLTALFCATALLITAFILLFSYSGWSPNNQSIESILDKTKVTNQPTTELKTIQQYGTKN